jgi:hypothetical protein
MSTNVLLLIEERISKYKQSEQHHYDQANGCAGAAQALTELLTALKDADAKEQET